MLPEPNSRKLARNSKTEVKCMNKKDYSSCIEMLRLGIIRLEPNQNGILQKRTDTKPTSSNCHDSDDDIKSHDV